MSFDRDSLIAACRSHGIVARVVVAATRGSVPREVGAAMLVWDGGMSGTIGGGTLEYQAMQDAQAHLNVGRYAITRHALGPNLGQCCGGAVDLLTEVYDLATAETLPEHLVARGTEEMPLAVARIKSDARAKGVKPAAQLIDGWMVEAVTAPTREIWIWGAGHVGRALAGVLAPLPGFKVTVVDTNVRRFPETLPEGVEQVVAAEPARLVKHVPDHAEHLIVTYSHTLDLALCYALLEHRFAFAGLIGSATKWARFRKRLADGGHRPSRIARITCPIGRPEFGKHPQEIALGVAGGLLERQDWAKTRLEGHG